MYAVPTSLYQSLCESLLVCVCVCVCGLVCVCVCIALVIPLPLSLSLLTRIYTFTTMSSTTTPRSVTSTITWLLLLVVSGYLCGCSTTTTMAANVLYNSNQVRLSSRVEYRAMAAATHDCSSQGRFAYPFTADHCFMENACYPVRLCCPEANATTEYLECVDTTHYSCNASLCAGREGDGYRVKTDTRGAYINCCKPGGDTTEAPQRPPIGGESDVEESYSYSPGPAPLETCDDVGTACLAQVMFASVMRALCPQLSSIISDPVLNANAANVCCWSDPEYGAPVNGTQTPLMEACGVDILDLPATGLFHCNLAIRGGQECCNGIIAEPANASSQLRVYTYEGSVCTSRTLEPEAAWRSTVLRSMVVPLLTLAMLCLLL